jgi:hypothetical protein
MKQLLVLLVFGVWAFGDTIPISVTGYGSFFLDNFGDNYASVCFSGSNGPDSVSLCTQGIPVGSTPSVLLAQSQGTPDPTLRMYTATVDGIQSNYYDLSLGAGYPQYLTLLDASGNVIVSQSIQGYIQITTDYEQNSPRFFPDGQQNDEWQASGTFLVVPTPEASSGILLCSGMCGTVLVGRRRKAG